MAGKHLSQDELQYVIDVKTAQAQQGIHKLEKQTTALRNENKQQYKNLSAVYRETGQQIKKTDRENKGTNPNARYKCYDHVPAAQSGKVVATRTRQCFQNA